MLIPVSDCKIIKELRKTSAELVVNRKWSNSSHCLSVSRIPFPTVTSLLLDSCTSAVSIGSQTGVKLFAFLLSGRELTPEEIEKIAEEAIVMAVPPLQRPNCITREDMWMFNSRNRQWQKNPTRLDRKSVV